MLDAVGADRLRSHVTPRCENMPCSVRPDRLPRRALVDLLVVVEFCRHPGDPAQADRVERYARTLDIDEPLLLVARDALTAGQAQVMADCRGFTKD
jgi:hypothetical protein